MPNPDRSQSVSNTSQSPPSQGLERRLLPRSSSMPKSAPSYNASIRSLGSRRHRPTVAPSIADAFVNLLVAASICHEHSPRVKRMSTICMGASANNMTRWQGWNVTGSRQLPPTRRRLDYLKPPIECPGARYSRTQRMFSSGAAQGVKDPDRDESPSRDNPGEEDLPERPERTCEETEAERRKDLDGNSPHRLPDGSDQDSIADTSTFSNEQNNAILSHTSSYDIPSDLFPSNLSTVADTAHSRGGASLAAEKYAATSELYRAVFGDELEWKKAVDAVNQAQNTNPEPRKVTRLLKQQKNFRYRYRNPSKRSNHKIPAVRELVTALWHEEVSNQYIFRLYREVPFPGVSHLSKRTRGEILRRFANPPNRRRADGRRYLALVDDMIESKLEMSRSLWTSALKMAGLPSSRVWKTDLDRTFGLWQQMEHEAGIESDEVVFNLMFDISIKAGQYTVADRFLQQMDKRGLSFNRFGRLALIQYYGMRGNVDGIRETYNDFVNSSDLVDTVTLNCLIVAFLRAGEVKTAEQLYHRMMQAQADLLKQLNKNPYGTKPHWPTLSSEISIYRKRALKLGRLLTTSAVLGDVLPEHHVALQEALPMTPDTRTFHILLKYHAHKSGNLIGFMSILADMENTFAIPPRGMIYLLLFQGFIQHGRRKRTWWTAERLQEAWRAYLRALYESKHRLDERFLSNQRDIVWENPLASTAAEQSFAPKRFKDDPSRGLYTQLPSRTPVELGESKGEHSESSAEERRDDEEEGDELDAGDVPESELDVEELFGSPIQNQPEPQPDELEHLERRIENGVFLSRTMINTVLGAFGTCCGPNEVMEVWLIMERIWQPDKRKMADVAVVKEELEKQMNRVRVLRDR